MKELTQRKKKLIYKFLIQILVVGLAGGIGGIAFTTFFQSQGITPTGLSGFALIISKLLSQIGINLSTSIVYLIINAIIFIFALRIFGWKFLVLSGVGIATYTIGMEFGYIDALVNGTGDTLLFAIVGAIIVGLTIGLALRFGGSTGGSEIAGSIINRYFPKIKTGNCILIINVIVLVLSIITGGVQTGLYALVVSIINSLATNMVLDGSKRVVAYYIICDKDEEVSTAILGKYNRGVTRLKALGMFSKQEKSLLLCVVPSEQSHEMKKLVLNIDKNAFIFSAPATETVGEGSFMKEMTVIKSRLKSFSATLKTKNHYSRHEHIKQLRLKRKQKRFRKFDNLIQNELQTKKDNKIQNHIENDKRTSLQLKIKNKYARGKANSITYKIK